jgi:hypothetical protein
MEVNPSGGILLQAGQLRFVKVQFSTRAVMNYTQWQTRLTVDRFFSCFFSPSLHR